MPETSQWSTAAREYLAGLAREQIRRLAHALTKLADSDDPAHPDHVTAEVLLEGLLLWCAHEQEPLEIVFEYDDLVSPEDAKTQCRWVHDDM